ncbi:unnamed protein product [Symbiodinium sp. CCMP2456]|nr:unnamed protein product [Symbiodinium sp. CCMP2456]
MPPGSGHQLCGDAMMQLSLDLSSTFDLVSWGLLDKAMTEAGVPTELYNEILSWYYHICYTVERLGEIVAQQGLRQGCQLAPTLWAMAVGYICKHIQDGQTPGTMQRWLQTNSTTYADDIHHRDTATTTLGLIASAWRSMLWHRGSFIKKWRRRHCLHTSDGDHLLFRTPGGCQLFLATSQATVYPTLMYGLAAVHLSPKDIGRVQDTTALHHRLLLLDQSSDIVGAPDIEEVRAQAAALQASTEAQWTVPEEPEAGLLPHTCIECGQSFAAFASFRLLRSHEAKQHGKRTPKCDDKPFDRFEHGAGGLPTCRHCGYRFRQWDNLIKHIKRNRCRVLRGQQAVASKATDPPGAEATQDELGLRHIAESAEEVQEALSQGSWFTLPLNEKVQCGTNMARAEMDLDDQEKLFFGQMGPLKRDQAPTTWNVPGGSNVGILQWFRRGSGTTMGTDTRSAIDMVGRQDMTMYLFMKTGDEGMIPVLCQAADKWRTIREETVLRWNPAQEALEVEPNLRAVTTDWVQFQIAVSLRADGVVAAQLHFGESPNSGPYRTVLYGQKEFGSERSWVTDDNKAAQLATDDYAQSSYLLWLRQVNAVE